VLQAGHLICVAPAAMLVIIGHQRHTGMGTHAGNRLTPSQSSALPACSPAHDPSANDEVVEEGPGGILGLLQKVSEYEKMSTRDT
jgi:hypothetical protein